MAETSKTTGTALLPDVGTLTYNNITFTQLYTSKISGEDVMDASGRTVMYVRYTLVIEGLITLNDNSNAESIDDQMETIRKGLSAQGGYLIYSGKGFGNPLTVNFLSSVRDVAWGPIPKILEFIPLGGNLSAQIKWQVTTCIPEMSQGKGKGTPGLGPVLQFNYETSVRYDEGGYSYLDINGILEIPLTRPNILIKGLLTTVDDYRVVFMNRIAQDFDLTRFKVVNREFKVSRDKRTMQFTFSLEEQAPMGLPVGILKANGKYSVKPLPTNKTLLLANVLWTCSLTCTYELPRFLPHRVAWFHFASLWNFRMRQSALAILDAGQAQQAAAPGVLGVAGGVVNILRFLQGAFALGGGGQNAGNAAVIVAANNQAEAIPADARAWPIYFGVDEGLYDDSKTVTFEARWILRTMLKAILNASGLWTQPPGIIGGNEWAAKATPISGASSWMINELNPAAQTIVDFGS